MEILIYGDGSFHQEMGLGAWAFRIPALGVDQCGVGPGKSSGRFEVLAILHGIETALTLDSSSGELCGITDCSEVTALAAELAAPNGGSLKSGVDKADLLPRLQHVLGTGRVTIQPLQTPAHDHHLCHLAAGRRLREEVQKNPILRYRVALDREYRRLRDLTEELQKLERRALELDIDLAVRRIQVQSLEKALLDLEQRPLEVAAGLPSKSNTGATAAVPLDDKRAACMGTGYSLQLPGPSPAGSLHSLDS
jgi:hypothetical protein